ncbi:MAG: ATP-binding protein [Actinomycetota bacterium]
MREKPRGGVVLDVLIAAGLEAAITARDLLEPLRDQVASNKFEDLLLLTTELVTNSVRHANLPPGSELSLRAMLTGEHVRVEVVDPGPGFDPTDLSLQPGGTSGWGLVLVDRIADRWGVSSRAPTSVWFELG